MIFEVPSNPGLSAMISMFLRSGSLLQCLEYTRLPDPLDGTILTLTSFIRAIKYRNFLFVFFLPLPILSKR